MKIEFRFIETMFHIMLLLIRFHLTLSSNGSDNNGVINELHRMSPLSFTVFISQLLISTILNSEKLTFH